MTNSDSNRYAYRPGKAYAVKKADSPADYLATALKAERFIASRQVEDADGISWDVQTWPGQNLSLYSGDAGIVYFYLKLHLVTREDRFKDIALSGAHRLAIRWHDALDQSVAAGYGNQQTGLGFLSGITGIGLVLVQVWRELHDENSLNAVRDIAQEFAARAKHTERGVIWYGHDSLAHDGGIILFLIAAQQVLDDSTLKELIAQAGEEYLARAVPTPYGGLIFDGMDGLESFSQPNFEFGTAGGGFIASRIYDATGDERYLNAAKRAAIYLDTIAVEQENGGILIPYRIDRHGVWRTDSGQPIFYLGLCHGPAGTAKLYYRLYELTGQRHYADQLHRLIDGFESLGAPLRQSPGLWNSVCYCCGHAGLVQFFVGLHQSDGNQRWHTLAAESASVLLGEAEELDGDAVDWPIAFERIHPDRYSRRIDYYEGAAGIASALLQIYLDETGNFRWSRLPDDPFPERL